MSIIKRQKHRQQRRTTKPTTEEAEQRKRDLALIHIAKKALGLSDAAYRDVVYSVMREHRIPVPKGQKPSSKYLDADARKALLATFRRMGWTPKRKRRPDPTPRKKGKTFGRYYGGGKTGEAAHLTQKQADYIAHLEDQLDWTDEPDRLIGFIERQIGTKKPVSMLRNREASRVITGLERLTGQKPHPRSKARTSKQTA